MKMRKARGWGRRVIDGKILRLSVEEQGELTKHQKERVDLERARGATVSGIATKLGLTRSLVQAYLKGASS